MSETEQFGRKLGEVHAFTSLGHRMFEKDGKDSLIHIFGEAEWQNMAKDYEETLTQVAKLAEELKTTDITKEKSQKTEDKLTKMQELYLGGQWDDPTEVAEWLGFFEGAATVHWSLIEGYGLKLEQSEVIQLAQSQQLFHEGILDEVRNYLRHISI